MVTKNKNLKANYPILKNEYYEQSKNVNPYVFLTHSQILLKKTTS